MPEQLTHTNGQSNRQWVTKAEMATHLNCTPRYINVLMRRRILPYVKARGLLRFDLADCDRALQLFKTRSLADPTQQPAVPQGRPCPAPAAPPPPPLPPEPAALPDNQATPSVRIEMFTSLIQMRTFLDTLENGTAVHDRNAHSENRSQIIVMVLRTGGEARAATDGPLGG